MRGVDLSIFDFDYDMQWYAMMLTADGEVLGRFGGRDADTPAKYQTLPGLRHSLETALKRYQTAGDKKPAPRMPMFAEDYSAVDKLPGNACVHCHHINEFRRDALQRQGRWSKSVPWRWCVAMLMTNHLPGVLYGGQPHASARSGPGAAAALPVP